MGRSHPLLPPVVMPTETGQAVVRPALSRMSTARNGFTPALHSCGASMEAPAMPPKLEAGTSSLLFHSTGKVPTNCSMDVLNHGCEKNAGGNFSSLSKRPFPIFKGEHPHIWKANCLNYFHVYNIHKCMWVIAAAMHMEGKAKHWLQVYKMQHELGSWNQFMDVVLEKFGKHDHCQAMIELSEVRKRGEVNEGTSAQAEKITFQAPADVVWDEDLQQVFDGHSSLTQSNLGGDNQMQYKQTNFNAHVLSKTQAKAAEVVWDEEVQDMLDQHGLLKQLALGGDSFVGEDGKLNVEPTTDDLLTNVNGPSLLLDHGMKSVHVVQDKLSGEDVVDAEQKHVHVQASGVWDYAVQEQLSELPCLDIIWDEESWHGLDLQDNLLQQVVALGKYCGGHKSKLISYPANCNLFRPNKQIASGASAAPDVVAHKEFNDMAHTDVIQHDLHIFDKPIFDEMSHKGIIWGEKLSTGLATHHILLQQSFYLVDDESNSLSKSITGDVLNQDSCSLDNKWSDIFGNFESMELHRPPRAPTCNVEANLIDNGHMEPELGAPDYQLCKVTLEVTGSVSYLPWVLQLDTVNVQDVAEMSEGQEMNHNRETFASSEEKQEASDLHIVFVKSQQWMELHTCKIQEAHEIPNLNKYSLYKVTASSRRQWDPGIMKLHIRQWFGCALKVAVGVIHRPAWGQAVFRGGGNVMTHMWPSRSSSDVRPINPSLGPSAAQELTLYSEVNSTGRGYRSYSETENRERNRRLSFSSPPI